MHNLEDLKKDKFYNSLSLDDKDRYLELQIQYNNSLVQKWFSEIFLNDFLEEKNYEDLDHEYDRPCYENIDDINKQNEFLMEVHSSVLISLREREMLEKAGLRKIA